MESYSAIDISEETYPKEYMMGNWVPASVARGLYRALEDILNNVHMSEELHDAGIKALAAADKE